MGEHKERPRENDPILSSPDATSRESIERYRDKNTDGKSATTKTTLIARSPNRQYEIIRQVPWMPVAAIILILLCIFISLYTLTKADGDTTQGRPWNRITPNVILSTSAIIANASLRFVAHEGSAFRWWYTALEGTTINDLQWTWQLRSVAWVGYGIFRGRFNRVGIATLTIIAVAAHGILFQRAVRPSSSVLKPLPLKGKEVRFRIAQELPDGWTGLLVDQSNRSSEAQVQLLTPHFALAVYQTTTGEVISMANQGEGVYGCSTKGGDCSLIVRGIGLNWTAVVKPDDTSNPNRSIPGLTTILDNGSSNSTQTELGFYVQVTGASGNDSHLMTIDIFYKKSSGCGEHLALHKRLTFFPATISYFVKINQNGIPENVGDSAVSATSPTDYLDPYPYNQAELEAVDSSHDSRIIFLRDQLGQKWEPSTAVKNFAANPLTYGGIVSALANLYNSYAIFRQKEEAEYEFSGTLAQQQFLGPSNEYDIIKPLVKNPCEGSWTDPTPDILTSIHGLMFRSALLAAINEKDMLQRTFAANGEYSPVWEIDWLFAIIAAIIPSIGLLLVLPTFWGFWQLDKRVTGSPVEIIEAFDIQRTFFDTQRNGKDVGQQIVRYVKKDGAWMMETLASDLTAVVGA